MSFQNSCSDQQDGFWSLNSLYWLWNQEKREATSKALDVLLEDVEITKLTIELFELQLDFDSEYSDQVITTASNVNNKTQTFVGELSEANIKEFNNSCRRKNQRFHRQCKPQVNRRISKFLLKSHDYMNVVETNLDSDSSDEDEARINQRLQDAFTRLQNGDFRVKMDNTDSQGNAKEGVIKLNEKF